MKEEKRDDFEFESLADSGNYKQWILSQFQADLEAAGSIVEVGAGIGQFSEALETCGGEVTVVEPYAPFYERLREMLPHLTAFQGTVRQFKDSSSREFDAVVSVNVLEHIEDDSGELQDWNRLLSENGKVCLLVPAFQSLYSPIDAKMGHFRRYSRREIRDRLRSAGFEVEVCRYFNFLGFFLWAVNFKWLRRKAFAPGAVVFFDRVLIYLAKGLDAVGLNALCGQSVVAIGRKKPTAEQGEEPS